jgi:hypothetical protein
MLAPASLRIGKRARQRLSHLFYVVCWQLQRLYGCLDLTQRFLSIVRLARQLNFNQSLPIIMARQSRSCRLCHTFASRKPRELAPMFAKNQPAGESFSIMPPLSNGRLD